MIYMYVIYVCMYTPPHAIEPNKRGPHVADSEELGQIG